MTYLDLWGEALDRELGTADRGSLFTVDRRKAAINDAQREFTRLTNCYVKEVTIPIVSGTREYDIETSAPDFWKFADRPIELWQTTVATGDVVHLTGDDFPRRDISWLDQYRPWWRGGTGVPTSHYVKTTGGAHVIGLDYVPEVPPTETWSLLVPYVANPTDMVADTDVPWSGAGEPLSYLSAWHPALAHFAASNLERYRKDYQASDYQLNRFAAYVSDYLQTKVPPARHVGFARDYRRGVSRDSVFAQGDPYRWP